MLHKSLKEHLQEAQSSFSHTAFLNEQNKMLFHSLMSAIATSAKEIAHLLTKPALLNILGQTGSVNIQGETVQKLDAITNNILLENLIDSGAICALGSEEEEHFVIVPSDKAHGRFVIFFDPLDGSSNIDVNVSVGTIFSIFYLKEDCAITEENLLQAGKELVAAGYVAYGAATILVYSVGSGVHGFTLSIDTKSKNSQNNQEPIEQFLLSHEKTIIPKTGPYYSANLGNFHKWQTEDQNALLAFQEKASLRYVGSLIADFHRTLLYGGVFSYPIDKKTQKGKLRLLYEVAPLSFLAEQAGGKALGADGKAILEKTPITLHERSSFLFGSEQDVAFYRSFFE